MRSLLPSNGPLMIAEVSSNHGRDMARCKAFVDAAADIGCDAVKFQLFRIRQLFAPDILACRPDLAAREAWELPVSFLGDLAEYAHSRGLLFACTPFDLQAVDELRSVVDFFKVASYELLWSPLLQACAQSGLPVVLSTGMADAAEIERAVAALRAGGCQDPCLLQCVSGYPAPADQCNLAAIGSIRQASGCMVGWSDHSTDADVIRRAVGHWQAPVVEFHLDLDGHGAEYAAGHCWLPAQMASLITELRSDDIGPGSTLADGDGVKEAVASEAPDRDWRADPIDGLRPLRHIRAAVVAEAMEAQQA